MRRQLTTRFGAICVCVLTLTALAGTRALSAPPNLEARGDKPASELMTPQAQIQLGVDRCDTELMMRQAGSFSYTYRVHSLWRGIVEYLLPQNGVFHRGDTLARIYDPHLLPDLERARRLMILEDVTPLTILEAGGESPEAGDDVLPASEDEAPAGGAEASGPPLSAPEAPSLRAEPHRATGDPASGDAGASHRRGSRKAGSDDSVDLVANRREQNLLREQARLTARTVAAAIQTRDEARAARAEADQEVADRQCLYEEGVLTEQALERGIEHADELTAALEQAEEELSEAQEGYARIARRIRALEQEAALAAAEAEAAASAVKDPVEPDEDTTPLAPAPLEEMTAEEEQPPALPPEVRELAAPRWEEVAAPGMGLVADVVAPPGSLVEEGQEVLELADVELARLTAGVRQRDMPEFWTGRTVTVTFEDYPAVALKGWVASCSPTDDGDDAEVEFLLLCDRGPFADDAYLAVHWMALEAGVRADAAGAHRLEPLPEPGPASRTQTHLRSLFPLANPWGYAEEPSARADCLSRTSYAGRLRLDPMPAVHDGRPSSPRRAAERRRLSALRDWRATYIEGMSTTILDDGTALTYPREGEVSRAVSRIIEGRVSHRANLCARTMREALGWGLGDAHAWARRLPHMDYAVRSDGLARPGDILVWPFTYGPGRAEHIGIAVRQGRRLMLLSNLGGRLGTSEVLGGYLAFYRPDQVPTAS